MKPQIICHIMTSVDGHIQVERWSEPVGDVSKTDLMKEYTDIGKSLSTDAWTFGKNTVRNIFPDGAKILQKDEKNKESDIPIGKCCVFIAQRHSEHIFISFDPDADIIYTASQLRGCDILVVLGRSTATPRYLMYLRKMDISYIVVEDIAETGNVLETINKEFGIKSISLQGGGLLNGAMLNKGMIDELSLVVYPGLDCNKESVSIFDNTIDDIVGRKKLELLSVQQRGHGVVWLRYQIHNE